MGQEVQIKRSEHPVRQRSLFWPIVLISIGVIWLLGNLGVISSANLVVLGRLWPLILIVVGLELLIGRNTPALSALIGIGGVALLVVLMLVGPSLGWAGDVEVKTASFSEPLDDAASARVSLNLGVADTTITALAVSNLLISADLSYIGDVEFIAEGETEKVISLSQTDDGNEGPFSIFGFGWAFQDENLAWNIGLSPDVPIDLNLNGGVGVANLALSGLQLTRLDVNGGVGNVSLVLPETPVAEPIRINGGVGEFHLSISGEPRRVTLEINGGVGQFTVDVPDQAHVTLNADGGVGSIQLPSNYQCVSGCDDNDFIGASGTWVTILEENAERQAIVINYQGGVGGLNIQ
jgi:hypothetical protein